VTKSFGIKQQNKIFIGGEWLPAQGQGISLTNPYTEEVFFEVAEALEQDVDAAVNAARAAMDGGEWSKADAKQRAHYIRQMSECLKERQSDLEEAFIQQVGGLASFAPIAVSAAVQTFARHADIAENYAWEAEQDCSIPNHKAVIVREAIGVVAAIAPWNMPLAIMIQKVAAALAAGCAVIMKPAPETPIEAFIIAECAEKAGLPKGALNLIPAQRQASDHLVRHLGVDKISFTGSTLAGKHIGKVAAERVARTTLELGGKSPAIVLEDMPIEQAADILANSTAILTGQVCALLSRAIVPRHMHDELATAIAERMNSIAVGDPRDISTQMGPIAMGRQLDRVQSYIDLGIKEGATLVCGGQKPPELKQGFFIQPTLFSNVDNAMRIAQEEIFGPVLCLIPYDNIDHAIEIANDINYGLNSAVLTTKPEKVLEIGRCIKAGNVGHNGLKADFSLPFGGFKESGIGREGGVDGMLAYTEAKVVLVENPQEGTV